MTFTPSSEDRERFQTQKLSVLSHLQTGAPLTQDQARELYGCMRLASRISELRKAGYLILSLRHETGVAVYLLLSDEGRDS